MKKFLTNTALSLVLAVAGASAGATTATGGVIFVRAFHSNGVQIGRAFKLTNSRFATMAARQEYVVLPSLSTGMDYLRNEARATTSMDRCIGIAVLLKMRLMWEKGYADISPRTADAIDASVDALKFVNAERSVKCDWSLK